MDFFDKTVGLGTKYFTKEVFGAYMHDKETLLYYIVLYFKLLLRIDL